MHERRSAEIRQVAADGPGTFRARAVTYGVVDDYNTRWVPGVFNDSLEQRLPVIAWAHDWAEPIGRVTGWEETPDGLDIIGRLDLGGSVPRASQAYEQMQSRTLSDVSVGFMRQEDRTSEDGVTEITKAVLDEVSIVLRGAVPGAKLLAVRSSATIPVELAASLLSKIASGEMDLHTALGQAKEAAGVVPPKAETPPEEVPEPEPEPTPDPEVVEAEAMLEEALNRHPARAR